MKYLYLFNENSVASEYGIGTYIQQMKDVLMGIKNISLRIVECRSDKAEFEIESKDNYEIYYIPSPVFLNRKYDNAYYRNIGYYFLTNINHLESDEIILHFNYFQEIYILKVLKGKTLKFNSIFTIHYQNWSISLKSNIDRFKRITHSKLEQLVSPDDRDAYKFYEGEKEMFELVDFIICLSTYTEKILLDEYGVLNSKVKYIPNGIELKMPIISEKDRCSLKKYLFFNESEKIILFVGRLDEGKGVRILIESFIMLLEYIPNSRLVMIGDGDFSKYLKDCNRFWSKIMFTGRLEWNDLYPFYQIADIGVLPSFSEQCSYTMLEMMSFGLPVIGSNLSGLKEMISEPDRIIQYEHKGSEVIYDALKIAMMMRDLLLNKNSEILPDKYRLSNNQSLIRRLYLDSCGTEKHIE